MSKNNLEALNSIRESIGYWGAMVDRFNDKELPILKQDNPYITLQFFLKSWVELSKYD